MKKHQLLEKAMRDYPSGTKICSTTDNGQTHTTEMPYCIDEFGSVQDTYGCLLYQNCMGKWAEIVKPSILSGKVAIQVSNEREFKLLMQHMHAKGWSWSGGHSCMPISDSTHAQVGRLDYKTEVMYQDNFLFNPVDDDWKIIPFSDFATEVGIKVPVFAFKSFDSVPMYFGDNAIVVAKEHGGNWSFVTEIPLDKENVDKLSVTIATNIFSTKEAAESWIKEQNKPKHATVQLFSHKDYKSAEITPDKITIRDADSIYYLKPSDLEDMLHAYKSLQQ